MKSTLTILAVALLSLSCLRANSDTPGDIATKNLRCEYLVNPLGIDVIQPRLSWEVNSNIREQKQTAYHILVASSIIGRTGTPGKA